MDDRRRCAAIVLALAGLVAAALGGAAPAAELGDAAIVELGAIELRDELAAGRLDAERVARVFLARIAALDDAGPKLGAVIEVNPDALAIARELDRRFRRGGAVGPLHGVPVLLKANIDTADRMATSAGSLALAKHHAAADSPVAAALRAAGAVLLAKTNLSEWANFRATGSISGWSSLGGQTRNPYVLDRNPCGSSSGSAVAVAARLAPLAVGTETDGSIVCPAGANGVVGIKPTLGLVSQRGIIPIAASQDTAGPFGRTVRDAALLLDVLAGTDPATRAAAPIREQRDLRGLRIGVIRDYVGAGTDAGVERAYVAALATLQAAGAELVDPIAVGVDASVDAAEIEVLLFEFHAQLDAYLADVRGPRSLRELIAYDSAHAAKVMPYFGQDLFEAAAARGSLDAPEYRAALARLAALRGTLARLFDERRLDVLVAPVNSRAWRTSAGGDAMGVASATLAAVTGYPSIAVPAALVEELPVALAFVGRPHAEALLAEAAAGFETARGPFPAPRFLPSIGD